VRYGGTVDSRVPDVHWLFGLRTRLSIRSTNCCFASGVGEEKYQSHDVCATRYDGSPVQDLAHARHVAPCPSSARPRALERIARDVPCRYQRYFCQSLRDSGSDGGFEFVGGACAERIGISLLHDQVVNVIAHVSPEMHGAQGTVSCCLLLLLAKVDLACLRNPQLCIEQVDALMH
jgi:hypothetical protein